MPTIDYESERLLAEYLHFHYSTPEEINPRGGLPKHYYDYARRIILERFVTPSVKTNGSHLRALDIGCAVGASSFEMALHCQQVIGIDYSKAFIETAEKLRAKATLDYHFYMEGMRTKKYTARVDPQVDRSRIIFRTGDAHSLPKDIGTFDWVLGANLLCRLHTPDRFLEQLPELMHSGGILVLNSPFTWMKEHTAPENWIGGHLKGPSCAQALRKKLEVNFQWVDEVEMPFLIRETQRKYQLTYAHSSKWVRK